MGCETFLRNPHFGSFHGLIHQLLSPAAEKLSELIRFIIKRGFRVPFLAVFIFDKLICLLQPIPFSAPVKNYTVHNAGFNSILRNIASDIIYIALDTALSDSIALGFLGLVNSVAVCHPSAWFKTLPDI